MDLSLNQQLQEKRSSILAKWRTYALSIHENCQLINAGTKQGRFSNPAAYITDKNTGKIFDWLLNPENQGDLLAPLQEICRLRAVQELKPSRALQFIPALKQIIREEVPALLKSQYADELWNLDQRIDEMALLAFDIYADCKTRINEIKINEMKRLYGRDAG